MLPRCELPLSLEARPARQRPRPPDQREQAGQVVEGSGRAGLEAHPVRQRDQPVGLHDAHRRVRARLAGVRDAHARLDRGHARANRLHHARGLAARNVRQLHRVAAHALVNLNEVHARRRDDHQRLPRPRLADRDVPQLQHLGPARLLDLYRFHSVPPLRFT